MVTSWPSGCYCPYCTPQTRPCGHRADVLCGCGSLPNTSTFITWPESDDGYVGRHRPEYVRP